MGTELRDFIFTLSKKAGNALMDSFQQDQNLIALRSTAKEAATEYDTLIDQFIIKEITTMYPHHSLLTEESGYHPGDSDWLWIVDSLDGTGNFANQNPFFCVCIALIQKGALSLGTIYAPAINEFYLAEKGKGAFLNKKRIHVSKVSDLQKSYLFFCEGGDKNRIRTGNILNKIYPKVTDIRKLGSAGLETAWVAAGKAEAYVTTKIDPWDVAPGVLLLSEAGGNATDFKENIWQPERGDLLFSNGLVHSDILELLREE